MVCDSYAGTGVASVQFCGHIFIIENIKSNMSLKDRTSACWTIKFLSDFGNYVVVLIEEESRASLTALFLCSACILAMSSGVRDFHVRALK